jgi:hypothetical protein
LSRSARFAYAHLPNVSTLVAHTFIVKKRSVVLTFALNSVHMAAWRASSLLYHQHLAFLSIHSIADDTGIRVFPSVLVYQIAADGGMP